MSKSVRSLKRLQQKLMGFCDVGDPVMRQLDCDTPAEAGLSSSAGRLLIQFKVRHPEKLVKHRVQVLCSGIDRQVV